MLWRYDPEKGFALDDQRQRNLNWELIADERNPSPGQAINLLVPVYNYSLVQLDNIDVHFFLGDPRTGGQFIGETTTGPIPPRGSVTVALPWTVPTPFMRFPEIYAVIDPDNTLEEVHENNNLSFNTFLLSCTTDCPIPDLSVTPASIRFDAETFTNSIVQIEVDVNTAEDVTDAVVSLFNGTLQQGTRIGDYTIGYIEEDSTGTALFTWDTTGLPPGTTPFRWMCGAKTANW
ncbi:MAG: hypothetical protein HC893_03460 [Chloroflexaceae bacterium]|nr:hypothetical protein [Chloroflexaceae bacterium]